MLKKKELKFKNLINDRHETRTHNGVRTLLVNLRCRLTIGVLSAFLSVQRVTETVYNMIQSELTVAVTSNNVKGFVKAVNRLLAKIPYEDYSVKKMLTRKKMKPVCNG